MMEWLILLILVAAYFLFEAVMLCLRRREKDRRFAARDDLTEDEFYDSFYSDSGIPKASVCTSLHILARTLETPLGKLRPGDCFGGRLRPSRWYDHTVGELFQETAWLVDSPEGIRLTASSTIDDYIRQVAPRLRKRDERRGGD